MPAVRQETACTQNVRGARTCRATLLFPGHGVQLSAASSTSADEVDRILNRVRVLPGRVDVAGMRHLDDGRAASHPPAWRATKPGRATITLTVRGAGGTAA